MYIKFYTFWKKKMIVIANAFPKLQTVKDFVRPLRKKRCFGTRFDSQHVKVSQILAKSPSGQFYHVFPSLWRNLIWKMSPLLLGEMLGVFVDTFTADGKYSVIYCENLPLPIQMQLSVFLNFSFHLWNLHQISNILKKSMMVIANVLPKLQTLENFVRPFCKKHRLRTRLMILAILTWWSWLMFFRSSRVWISWLDHSLKSNVSEIAVTVNMWKSHKYLRNLHESTFIMCFHHFDGSWFGKCLPYY